MADIIMNIEASRNVQQAPIDTSLTITGMAADSKAVGDAIKEVSDYVGAGTIPGGSASLLGAVVAIYNKIGQTALPSGSETLTDALKSISDELSEVAGTGIEGKTLTQAINEVVSLIGNTPLPLEATTVSEALNAILNAAVQTVNGNAPDADGNVDIDTGVMTVNGNAPDEAGNIQIETGNPNISVNGNTPDENGAILVNTGVMTVNGDAPENGNIELDVVRTVNGTQPDESGDVDISHVSLADDLYTDTTQENSGVFIVRMAGGNASIADGVASIRRIRGRSVRTGYLPEVRDMTITFGTRTDEQAPIEVEVDWDVFISQVGAVDTTLNISYDGDDWDYNLATYGVTIASGTPVSGDIIHLSYEVEVRGTITNSFPTSFTATGWNLYDNTTGYARVVRYSDEYGYRIDGTYSTIKFCTEQGGSEISVSVDANGLFNVPSDGYIHIVGGNNTDTAIYPTWSDWINGTPEAFESYVEYTIPLTIAINAIFAAGLCSVGTVRDELNPYSQTYVRRINRLAYSQANLESVIALGTDYTYDTNYIYYVLEEPISGTYTMDNSVTVSSHGLEFFNSATEIDCSMIYGQSLKDKLRRNVLTISQQTLDDAQKDQVRENIGASRIIRVPRTGTISLPSGSATDLVTFSDSRIKSNMYLINAEVGVPSAISGSLSITTSNGSVTVHGSNSRTPNTIVMFLAECEEE